MSEDGILKECNQLFVTMINCHINGKPMADLLALYEQEKEKNKKLEEHQKQYLDGELITANQGKFFEKIIKENYIHKDKIRNLAENIKEERNFYDKDEEAEWGQYNKYETYDYFYNQIKDLLEDK